MAQNALHVCFRKDRYGSRSVPSGRPRLVTLYACCKLGFILVWAFQPDSGSKMIKRERFIQLLRDVTGSAWQTHGWIDRMRIGVTLIAVKGSKGISIGFGRNNVRINRILSMGRPRALYSLEGAS